MKPLLTIALLAFVNVLQAQELSEDFDGYAPNQFITSSSANWSLWTPEHGDQGDAIVTDEQAHSGKHSIYLYSTSKRGGPQDVVFSFGKEYDHGTAAIEFMIFISNGSDAYFNIQGNDTIAKAWTIECFIENGELTLSNTRGMLLTGAINTGRWSRISFAIDLNENKWEAFIDSNSIGTFRNK